MSPLTDQEWDDQWDAALEAADLFDLPEEPEDDPVMLYIPLA